MNGAADPLRELSSVEPDWLQAFRILEELEEQGVGQDWRVDGLDIWPMLKTLTVAPLIHSALDKTPQASGERGNRLRAFLQARLGSLGSASALLKVAYPKSDLTDVLLSDPNSQRAIWCLGNTGPTHAGPLGFAHVHFDPFRLFAQSRGLDHWALFYNERADSQRVTNALIGPNRGILREISSPYVSPWRAEINLWKQSLEAFFVENFRNLHPDIPSLLTICMSAISRTLFYRDAFRRVFEKRRPQGLLCFNYYQRVGWALCAAAREAGIPLYDIQHGAQGRFHHAYHWARIPAGGWNTTPQGYLLYGIPRDTEVSGGACYVGAPSWYLWCRLALTSDHAIPVPARWQENAALLLKDAKMLWKEAEQRSASWLMYASFADEAPGRIDRLAARLQGRVHIQQKRHPTKIQGDLSPIEKLPLPCVLAAMDGLVSGYSATILEAAKINLPSFVLSRNAKIFYEGLPLQSVPDEDDLAASMLANCSKILVRPEDRLSAALENSRWPSGWI